MYCPEFTIMSGQYKYSSILALDHHQKTTGNLVQPPFLINITCCGTEITNNYLDFTC